jgi:hypothetical protein
MPATSQFAENEARGAERSAPRAASRPNAETAGQLERPTLKVDLLSCCELRLSSSFVSRHLDSHQLNSQYPDSQYLDAQYRPNTRSPIR